MNNIFNVAVLGSTGYVGMELVKLLNNHPNININFLGSETVTNEYLTNIECTSSLLGDLNEDLAINVQDVILTVNLILSNEHNSVADLNSDGNTDVIDVILLVGIIIN